MNVGLPTGRWLRTKDLVEELSWSTATLFRRKKERYFNLGTHYVTTGPGSKANLLWNLEACRKVQATWEPPVEVG